jgi:hypothetical protein
MMGKSESTESAIGSARDEARGWTIFFDAFKLAFIFFHPVSRVLACAKTQTQQYQSC